MPQDEQDVLLPAPPKTPSLGGGPPTLQPADPALPWKSLARSEALKRGFDPEYVVRLIGTESNWNPQAIGRITKNGERAQGIAQFMPATAKSLGIDPMDPQQAIPAAVSYLYGLHEQFGGDDQKATAAYNAGAAAVQQYNGVPPFLETQNYLKQVLPKGTHARLQGIDVTLPALPTPPPPDTAGNLSGLSQATSIGPGHPSWIDTARTLLPAAGGFLGDVAAGAAGIVNPVLGAAARVVAGGAGAAAGEVGSIGLEHGAHALGFDDAPPPNFSQSLNRVQTAATRGAVGSAVGVGTGAVLGKVASPLTSTVSDVGREAMKVFPEQQIPRASLSPLRLAGSKTKSAPGLLPAQISDSRAIQIGQNVAEGSFLGGGRIKAIQHAQGPQALKLAQNALDEFGVSSSPEQVGQAVQAAREGGLKTASTRGSAKYDQVFHAADAAKVEVTPTNLEAFVKQEPRARTTLYRLLDNVAPGWNKSADGAVMGDGTPIPEALKAVLQSMGELPADATGGISLKAAHNLRSELLSAGRTLERTTKDVPAGYTKRLAAVIDEDLHAAAGPELSPQLRSADAFWKTEVADRFKTTFLRGLAKQDPSKAALVLSRPNVSVESLRQARGAVPTTVWRQVQRLKGDQLLNAAKSADEQTIHGTKLLDELRTQRHQLREIYDGADQGLWQLGRVLERIQQKGEGTGGVYIKLAQASAATAAVTFSATPAAGAILLGPAVISRLMTSPTGMKLLAQGLDGFPKTALTGKAGLQFLAQVTRDRDTEDAYQASEPPAMPSHGPPTRPGTLGPPGDPMAAYGPPGRP